MQNTQDCVVSGYNQQSSTNHGSNIMRIILTCAKFGEINGLIGVHNFSVMTKFGMDYFYEFGIYSYIK